MRADHLDSHAHGGRVCVIISGIKPHTATRTSIGEVECKADDPIASKKSNGRDWEGCSLTPTNRRRSIVIHGPSNPHLRPEAVRNNLGETGMSSASSTLPAAKRVKSVFFSVTQLNS